MGLDSGRPLLQGLRCQASSVLAATALQQLSHPLVRDCCATVAASAGALVLVKLAEVLTYKGLIDQVCPYMRARMYGIRPLANARSNPICLALLETIGSKSSLIPNPISDVPILCCTEAEQEAGAHPSRTWLRSVLAPIQVLLLTPWHLVCSA